MFYNIKPKSNNTNIYLSEKSGSGYTTTYCANCKRLVFKYNYGKASHHYAIVGGRDYSDCLQLVSGSIPSGLLVSKKVIQTIIEEKISGWDYYESIDIVKNEIKIEKQYFLLRISGSCDLDYSKMNLKKKNYCSLCGQYDLNRKRLGLSFIDKSSWDGSDLCSIKTTPGFLLCSSRFYELSKTKQFKGFDFFPDNMVYSIKR